jgi:hypothetical protein
LVFGFGFDFIVASTTTVIIAAATKYSFYPDASNTTNFLGDAPGSRF